jgi:hypothetical protein
MVRLTRRQIGLLTAVRQRWESERTMLGAAEARQVLGIPANDRGWDLGRDFLALVAAEVLVPVKGPDGRGWLKVANTAVRCTDCGWTVVGGHTEADCHRTRRDLARGA